MNHCFSSAHSFFNMVTIFFPLLLHKPTLSNLDDFVIFFPFSNKKTKTLIKPLSRWRIAPNLTAFCVSHSFKKWDMLKVKLTKRERHLFSLFRSSKKERLIPSLEVKAKQSKEEAGTSHRQTFNCQLKINLRARITKFSCSSKDAVKPKWQTTKTLERKIISLMDISVSISYLFSTAFPHSPNFEAGQLDLI